MNLNSYPSKLLQNAVEEFTKLPGIGRKTALRLVLHLLNQPHAQVEGFATSMIRLRNEIKRCQHCNCISDTDTCTVCSNRNRNSSLVCVVESVRDVMSIECTAQYNGLYYVLGGLIRPMDGVGPADISIDGLVNKISTANVKEVIMALSATMEGDTTSYYIYKKIKHFPVDVSVIARGIALGDDLEYADEVTLGRAIITRTRYEAFIAN